MVRDAKPFLNHVPKTQTIRIWVPVQSQFNQRSRITNVYTYTDIHTCICFMDLAICNDGSWLSILSKAVIFVLTARAKSPHSSGNFERKIDVKWGRLRTSMRWSP